jgi:uncharacterized protein
VDDPRPLLVGRGAAAAVLGGRCMACGRPSTGALRCPACGGELADARFGPGGAVWSSTVVRIPVGERVPPYALAYVDLDGDGDGDGAGAAGPRVLARADGPLPIGSRVRLVGPTADGDLHVEAERR